MSDSTALTQAVVPAVTADLPLIYWLFEQAMAYQQAHGFIGWHTYDKNHIAADVAAGQVFKIRANVGVAAIFSVCYTDALIWREREQGNALYLHRAIVHPDARGGLLFRTMLEWARVDAAQRRLKYIRMDTWADNNKLIDYYRGYGFRFVENYTTANDPNLPDQHRNLRVALLEYAPGSSRALY